MLDNLVHAYAPLVTWTGLGLLLSRLIPNQFPKFLGYGLYWIGVPLQLFVLARHTEAVPGSGLIPWLAIALLLVSMGLALASWQVWHPLLPNPPEHPQSTPVDVLLTESSVPQRATLGSFILAIMLGNTGFVGLALTQVLTNAASNTWAVLFSVTSNVVGTYGMAVFIASYFGRQARKGHWWVQLRDVLTVPSLWTFAVGWQTRGIPLPAIAESGLEQAVWVVICCALMLVGLRLGTMQGWQSFRLAAIVTVLKIMLVPLGVGLGATWLGVTDDPRLVLVLMSGTPTGLSVLILAEVYDLDRDLLTSSIALTFVGLLLALPLWLAWFS